jgi:LDH2 family malate/lactate/ureidoglycolate dehydrogenase
MNRVMDQLEVAPESTKALIEALIATSYRGTDSHGIGLFPHYTRVAVSGRINRNPDIRIIRNAGAVSMIDADHSFGHIAGTVAMKEAVRLAGEYGIGSVTVKNSSHFAAASFYSLIAAEQQMIGICFSNSNPLVKVPGSREAFFGTNPISFAAPMQDEAPFCFDMATSESNWNRIMTYKREGKKIPLTWAYDQNGQPTDSPDQVKLLAPFGGHKGYAIGMIIDILCSLLTGGPPGKDLQDMYSGLDKKRLISHHFMAINPDFYSGIEFFKAGLQSMAGRIRALPRLQDQEPVLIPGDRAKKMIRDRQKSGLPVDDLKYREFLEISPDFETAVIPADNSSI